MNTILPLKIFATLLPLLAASCTIVDVRTGSVLANPTSWPSPEHSRIEGAWVATYDEFQGRNTHREGAVFHFQKDRHWIKGDKGFESFAIDPTASPKQIDFYDHKTPTIQGIYKIEGNNLTLCTAKPGMPRPTTFSTSPRNGDILTKTRRQ